MFERPKTYPLWLDGNQAKQGMNDSHQWKHATAELAEAHSTFRVNCDKKFYAYKSFAEHKLKSVKQKHRYVFS